MRKSAAERDTPFVDFRYSRLYFGPKFWLAVALVICSVLGSILADGAHPVGKAILAMVGIAGVVVGLLLQPSPKPVDHRPRARQAMEKLTNAELLLVDVRTMAAQLTEADEHTRIRLGLVSITQDLNRASGHVVSSMAEWDQVAPGAFEESRATQIRGREMLLQLAQEGGEAVE